MESHNGHFLLTDRNTPPPIMMDDGHYSVNADDEELVKRDEENFVGRSIHQAADRGGTTVVETCRDPAEKNQRTEDNMASHKGENCFRKWPPRRVVMTCVACFIVQFTMGISYSAGNMLPYLTSYLHVRTDTSVGYAVAVWFSASYAIAMSASMPLWGLLEHHLPRWAFRLLGIVLFSGSFFGASWAIKTSFGLTLLCVGVIQGCGQAVLYPACLNLPMQWLPESRGLLGGLIMAGFGAGGFLWDQVITNWINPHNLQPDVTENEDLYFSQTTVLDRVPTCYLLLGSIMSAVQILCLLCMSYPSLPLSGEAEINVTGDTTPSDVTSGSSTLPANTSLRAEAGHSREESSTTDNIRISSSSPSSSSPASLSPSPISPSPASPSSASPSPTTDKAGVDGVRDYRPMELFRSRAMLTITTYFFFVDVSILIVSSFYKSYGQTFVHNDRLLSIMASFSSVVNAVCRPVWGFLADRHGFHVCLIFSQVCVALGSALLVICERAGAAMLFLVVCLVFLGIGGTYGLGPPLVCTLFGPRNFTFNLGFLAFSGILGALMDVYVVQAAKDAFGWQGIFLAACIFTLIGLLINWSLVCGCGHPLPAHIKGPLFHSRRHLDTRSDVKRDSQNAPV